MSISFDSKTHKYFVQYKTRDAVTSRIVTHRKRGFDGKKDARRWEVQARDQASMTEITFAHMAQMYFDSLDCNAESRLQKEHVVDCYFPMRDNTISQITRADMGAWRSWLMDQDLATRTKNRFLSEIRSIFHYGSIYYNTPDPAVVLKGRKARPGERKEMKVWNVDEFDQFLVHVERPVYRIFFEFLFWTGCRRGEALALQVDDVADDGMVTIDKSIKHYQNGFLPTKNNASIRRIQLDKKTLQDVLWLKAQHLGPFLFGGPTSLGITQVDREFRKTIQLSGVPRIRIHDLRHSHATLLINHGVNIVAVSKRLGHSNVETTLRTYTHLLERTDQEMMDRMNGLHTEVCANSDANGAKRVPQKTKTA